MRCKNGSVACLTGMLLMCAVFCACNNNGSADSASDMRKRDNLTLVKYLKLVDEQYVLDISEEDAIKLGVSKESYRSACEDIVRENANIRKIKEEGGNYSLEDPQEHMENYKRAEEEYLKGFHGDL